jgi:glycosyltransferase involved in cell wall biosynthesis
MPKISILIPAYNCAHTIGRAIESARRQTLRDIEIVVVDDASSDGTFAFVESLAAVEPRIKCMRLTKNGGASAARNAAIEMATGEWVAVLDADDWYENDRLEIMLAAAEKMGADLVCDNLEIFDHARREVVGETDHGRRNEIFQLTPEYLFDHDNPLRRHAIGYLKPMMRKDFLRAHNLAYDLRHRAGEDFLLLTEIVLNGGRAFVLPVARYVYVHRISPTTRKISPSSRSEAGFTYLVEGCDELARKYGKSMTPVARKALAHRRWIFESRIKCDHMLAAVRQKNFPKALAILAGRPFILILIGTTLTKWIYANILLFERSLKGRVFSRTD